VPVVTRKRSVRILLVVAAAFPLLLAGGAALLSVVFGQSCSAGGVGVRRPEWPFAISRRAS